jgi:hypothetical protein
MKCHLSEEEKKDLELASRYGSHNEFFLKREDVKPSNLGSESLSESLTKRKLVFDCCLLVLAVLVFLYLIIGCSPQPRINGDIPFSSFSNVHIQHDQEGHAVFDIIELAGILNKHGFVVVPMDQWKGLNESKEFYRESFIKILRDMERKPQ